MPDPTAPAGSSGPGSDIAAQAADGLDMAAQAAGDVLRGIFGGLPWEMDPGAIVDAVTGALPGAAQPGLIDVGVLLL